LVARKLEIGLVHVAEACAESRVIQGRMGMLTGARQSGGADLRMR